MDSQEEKLKTRLEALGLVISELKRKVDKNDYLFAMQQGRVSDEISPQINTAIGVLEREKGYVQIALVDLENAPGGGGVG